MKKFAERDFEDLLQVAALLIYLLFMQKYDMPEL